MTALCLVSSITVTNFCKILYKEQAPGWCNPLGRCALARSLCTMCVASVVRQSVLGICRTLTLAMAAGIGFFLAHIGYQAGEGIGLVVADPATLVTIGET